MEIITLLQNHLLYYCTTYGILTEKAAIVIDVGKCTEEMVNFLNENKDKERLILLTHNHFDHVLGANELRMKTGVKIACDQRNFEKFQLIVPAPYERYKKEEYTFSCNCSFTADCEIKVGDVTVKAIYTPGHTKGGVSYLIGDNLFSGDTLFRETVGKTIYPTSSAEDMRYSLDKLKTLPERIKIYPAHGETTDMAHEKEFNPFLR